MAGRDKWILLRPLEKLADVAADLKEIYIYCNNDIEGFAVSNATTLRGYLQGVRDS